MTKRIYEIDAYMKESVATIEYTREIDGNTWISLDQTIFYPEGGGQPSDIGLIEQIPVKDVQVIGKDIFHKISKPIDKIRVKLVIDFKRRFDHMQQHTGQHLLSAVWFELYQIKTISFHLGKDFCTIDLEASEITDEQIDKVEYQVMQYIFENRTVENYVMPFEEVDETLVKKLKEKPSFVRLVEIDGIDCSACCGTHVSNLGELGLIKIIGWEKHKHNVRLTFLSGERAFTYFQQVLKAAHSISKKLNVSATAIEERFNQFFQSSQLLKKNHQKLYDKAIHQEANDLVKQQLGTVIEVTWNDRPVQEMKDLAKIIIESGDKVVLFQNEIQKTWIFASSSSQLFNVSVCIKTLKQLYGGNGGGNSVFGQWIGEVSPLSWHELKKQWFY